MFRDVCDAAAAQGGREWEKVPVGLGWKREEICKDL